MSGGIGGEQQGDVHAAVGDRLVGEGPAGVEGQHLAEGQPVDPFQARAGRRVGTRTRAGRRRSSRGPPRRGRSAFAGRSRSAVSRVTTKVLASCAGEGASTVIPRSAKSLASWSLVPATSVGADVGGEARELERTPGVLRHHLDQTAGERRQHELPGAETERTPHLVAVALQGLAVDLGHQFALGEVERSDGDRVVAKGRRRLLPRPNRPRHPAPNRTRRRRHRVQRGRRKRSFDGDASSRSSPRGPSKEPSTSTADRGGGRPWAAGPRARRSGRKVAWRRRPPGETPVARTAQPQDDQLRTPDPRRDQRRPRSRLARRRNAART